MRINIYNEEIANSNVVITKTSENGILFYGYRIFLVSPSVLHHTDDDDDTSAVTFWFDSYGMLRDFISSLPDAYE